MVIEAIAAELKVDEALEGERRAAISTIAQQIF
jgi:hypothetical protein